MEDLYAQMSDEDDDERPKGAKGSEESVLQQQLMKEAVEMKRR